MRGTAATMAIAAALGTAGTAVAAACPDGQQNDRPQDPTSTTQTTDTTGSATREYSGTVVAVNRKDKKFRLRDDDSGTITIKIGSRTDFSDGVSSLRELKKGTDDVDVTAKRTSHGLVATAVGCPGGEDQGDGADGQPTPAA